MGKMGQRIFLVMDDGLSAFLSLGFLDMLGMERYCTGFGMNEIIFFE